MQQHKGSGFVFFFSFPSLKSYFDLFFMWSLEIIAHLRKCQVLVCFKLVWIYWPVVARNCFSCAETQNSAVAFLRKYNHVSVFFLPTHKLDSLSSLAVVHQIENLKYTKTPFTLQLVLFPQVCSQQSLLHHHFSEDINEAIDLFIYLFVIAFNLIGFLWLLHCWKYYLIK